MAVRAVADPTPTPDAAVAGGSVTILPHETKVIAQAGDLTLVEHGWQPAPGQHLRDADRILSRRGLARRGPWREVPELPGQGWRASLYSIGSDPSPTPDTAAPVRRDLCTVDECPAAPRCSSGATVWHYRTDGCAPVAEFDAVLAETPVWVTTEIAEMAAQRVASVCGRGDLSSLTTSDRDNFRCVALAALVGAGTAALADDWHEAGLSAYRAWDRFSSASTPVEQADAITEMSNAMVDLATFLPGYDAETGTVIDPNECECDE